MSRQNIYDDNMFFESYRKLRTRVNANDIVEIPSLFKMIPSLDGLSILDMGCGYGEHCIIYEKLAIEDLYKLDQKFDLIVSSLALHYIEGFNKVVKQVYRLLNNSGVFIFSQEHPQYKDNVHKPDFLLVKARKEITGGF